jgi:hypothetical protein
LYIGTNNGLLGIKASDVINAKYPPIPVYISNISIRGRDTAVRSGYVVNYGNSISFGFSAISYSTEKAPTYFYSLEGADKEWSKTTSEKIQYDHLAPGDYRLLVYAEGWQGQGTAIAFTVLPPYWQKWWFILAEVLAGLIILAGIFYAVVAYKHRKSDLLRKMIENDLKSLRAQINPHFIFNALNSIQDFIFSHQPRQANYFLSQFSRLIRVIVDNSAKEYISLEDEIKFLKLYLELEKLRIGETLSFQISCDEQIDAANIGIPSMIVQPIIENALVHGLPMVNGEKKLLVHFVKSGQMLNCIITDNGIGRKRAHRYKKQNVSMGLSNITERLQLVCTRENTKIQPIVITDVDEHALNTGTRVSIFIPLIQINS